MTKDIQQQWHRIGDTNTFTTGHYVIEKSAVRSIFESELFGNGENIGKVENNELVTTRLKSDRRILFYFFPLNKVHGKYIMEGNVSGVALEDIDEILPKRIKDILLGQKPVRYG